MTEAALKSAGKKLLEKWGWQVIHLIQTNVNGIPDTLILRNKRALFIEWKRPGQEPRPLQSYRHRKLREQGFETLIVHYIEDLKDLK